MVLVCLTMNADGDHTRAGFSETKAMLIKEEKEMQAMRQQDQMKKAQSIARKCPPHPKPQTPNHTLFTLNPKS